MRPLAPATVPFLTQRLSRIAFAGMVAWLGLLFLPLATDTGTAEEAAHLVLLAPLALVPLFLTASVPASFAPAPRVLTAASWLLIPGMIGAAGSLLVPGGLLAGALAAVWLLPTVTLAVWAAREALDQWQSARLDAAEGALALGWATLPGGALWLVLARSGIDTGYGSLVALLTAAHFHYAGALVLVWAGLLGRTLPARWHRLHAGLVIGLAVGFWGVAVGIALSRGPTGGSLVEALGVATLTTAAIGVGVLGVIRAGTFEDRTAGLMVAVSGGALALAMVLAGWFQFGARLGIDPPDIAWMTARHGWLNAFGFGLWGALGWRRVRPRQRA